MSTHRNTSIPRNVAKRIPEESLFTDGVRRFFLYACRTNDRHRVVVPVHSLAAVPNRRCPVCKGKLLLQSTFWDGDVPAEGYDPDSAFETILRDGYYAWQFGRSTP